MSPDEAAELFREVIAAFPSRSPTDEDVRFLLRVARVRMTSSRDDAATAVRKMIAARADSDLQTPPRVMPLFLPARMGSDPDEVLKAQVKSLALSLNVEDSDNSAPASLQSRPSVQSPIRGSSAVAKPSYSDQAAGHSSAFKNAVAALSPNISEDDVSRLVGTIDDKEEQAVFYAITIRILQGRPDVVIHLAPTILLAINGSGDPQLSLTVPRMVLEAALKTSNLAMAQLAIASFSRQAVSACTVLSGADENAEFTRASACIAEYGQAASDIAGSATGSALQLSDPGLIERVNRDLQRNCGTVSPVPRQNSSRVEKRRSDEDQAIARMNL